MKGARFHVPLRVRSPRDHHVLPQTDSRQWLKAIAEALATRADLAITVSIDGTTLVDSRSVEHASHEVTVWTNPENPLDRRAVRCSCWLFKRKRPCAHRAFVAIRLWEEALGADLTEVKAQALVNTLLNAYLTPIKGEANHWWYGSPDGPETHSPEPTMRLLGDEPTFSLD